MVPGVKFYEKAMEFQRQYHEGMPYTNGMQTNAVMVNKKWVDFFKANDFQVSVSIDGPRKLHDTYRVDFRGRGSFDRVIRGIERLRDGDVHFGGVVVVISRANIEYVDQIYDFLEANRLNFNVVPMNRSGGARSRYSDLGLDADEYGPAWIQMYDRWFEADQDQFLHAQDFVGKTRAVIYGLGGTCTGLSKCAHSTISTDPLGDVYPCGSLSGHDDQLYGNLMEQRLPELMESTVAADHQNRNVDPECASCKWQHVCHGGCPARSYKFYGDYHHRDYYCPSLFKIYEHIEQRIAERGMAAGAPHPLHMTDGLPLRDNSKIASGTKRNKIEIRVLSNS